MSAILTQLEEIGVRLLCAVCWVAQLVLEEIVSVEVPVSRANATTKLPKGGCKALLKRSVAAVGDRAMKKQSLAVSETNKCKYHTNSHSLEIC